MTPSFNGCTGGRSRISSTVRVTVRPSTRTNPGTSDTDDSTVE